MSEDKKYLMTIDEIVYISEFDWPDKEGKEWLEAHEYHERTCHAVNKQGKPYEPHPFNYLMDALCSECGGYLGGQDTSYIGRYCTYCRAKVVTA